MVYVELVRDSLAILAVNNDDAHQVSGSRRLWRLPAPTYAEWAPMSQVPDLLDL